MFYLNLDDNGYLLSISKIKTNVPSVESLDGLDLSGYRINAHRWTGSELVFDEERYAEIETEIQAAAEAASAPTQLDRIEAQATYTAMMTDTLLEV